MVKHFSLERPEERTNYAIDRLGCDRDAAIELVRRTEGDFRLFESETEKLALLDHVDLAAIRENVREHAEVSLFRVTDALLAGSVASAIRELRLVLVQEEIRSFFPILLS